MLTSANIQPDKYPPNVIDQIPVPWHEMFEDDFEQKFKSIGIDYGKLIIDIKQAKYVPSFREINRSFIIASNKEASSDNNGDINTMSHTSLKIVHNENDELFIEFEHNYKDVQ
eukprot:276236_1